MAYRRAPTAVAPTIGCNYPGEFPAHRYHREREEEEDDGSERESIVAAQHASGRSIQYGGPHVHMLEPEEFDHYFERHPDALVAFEAKWCGHCQHLAPEYEQAAQEWQEEHHKVKKKNPLTLQRWTVSPTKIFARRKA
jgi:thiol-disulfide isomerase/thioredoxin